MEKPLFRLTAKDFESGISLLGAHSNKSGLWYKAVGLTPLFDAGSSQSANNGLLMAGADGTAISYGSVTGTFLRIIPDGSIYTVPGLIGVTSANEIVSLNISDASIPEFGAIGLRRTVSGQTLTPGIVIFKDYLFYRQIGQMGRTDGSTYTDNWNTGVSADYFGAMHVHYLLDKVYFSNGLGQVGMIDSSLAVTQAALTIDSQSYATSISDDGAYVVIAITRNLLADSNILTDSRILYWDGSKTTGFIKEHTITDPFIYSLEKTPIGLFAFGVTGIWQVTIDGVKKIFNHNPGIYTASGATAIHYGKGSTSYFSNALLWGGQVGSTTSRTLKSFGKLDSEALFAYHQPVKLTSSVNITAVNAQILKGYVFVADSTPALKYFPIGSGTPQTGVSGQTVYISLPSPHDITHIDVTFGEPLASGDTLDLDVYKDEDTSAVDFGAVSYDSAKTTRRYQFRPASGGHLEVNSQLAIAPTFTAGAVKIKSIEVFGISKERTNV